MKQTLTLLLLLLLLSCSTTTQQEQNRDTTNIDSMSSKRQKKKINEFINPTYYYIDNNSVIHSSIECISLQLAGSDGNIVGLKTIPKNEFIIDSTHFFCLECVIEKSIHSSIISNSDRNKLKKRGMKFASHIELGEYAYLEIDKNNNPLLHSTTECCYITNPTEKIKANDLRKYRGNNIYPCCVHCIDDSIYTQIKRRNPKKIFR